MGRQTHTAGTFTAGTTRRRAAGVVVGLVLAAGAAGAGTAFADPPLGCPAGYTLSGDTCRNGSGGSTYGLLMLPGDRDPQSGRVLVPEEGTADPDPTTTTPPVPTTTTTTPPVTTTTTTTPPVTTTTTPPATTTTTTPPVTTATTTSKPPSSSTPPSTTPRPAPAACLLPGQAPDLAAEARARAAVDRARAMLVADVRRGAPVATLRADAAAVVTAVGDQARIAAAQRPCGAPAGR